MVTCQACHIVAGNDLNLAVGRFTGEIHFGPNMISGVINETEVMGYRVKLVYSNGIPAMASFLQLYNPLDGDKALGTMIMKGSDDMLGSASSFRGDCCWQEKYKVKIMNVELPVGAEAFAMVIPVSTKEVNAKLGAKVKLMDLPLVATPAPTPPPPPTPAPAPAPAIHVKSTVTGIDYAVLNNDATLKRNFEDKCKDAIVQTVNAQSGPNIVRSNVAIVLSAGSVKVDATITPPSTVSFVAANNMEVGLNGATSALQTNMANQVAATPGLAAATTGTIGATVNLIDSFSRVGEPTTGCTWKFSGYGYCFAGGYNAELPQRIGTWVSGGIQEAKAACCADTTCGGLHWDTNVPSDYVKLDTMGTPDAQDGTRRQCWEKLTPADTDISAAASVRGLLALALAPVVALLLH